MYFLLKKTNNVRKTIHGNGVVDGYIVNHADCAYFSRSLLERHGLVSLAKTHLQTKIHELPQPLKNCALRLGINADGSTITEYDDKARRALKAVETLAKYPSALCIERFCSSAHEGILTDLEKFYRVTRCSNLEEDKDYFKDHVWKYNQPLKVEVLSDSITYELPDWLNVELAKKVLSKRYETTLTEIEAGKTGRFIVGDDFATTERDAIFLAIVDMVDVNEIEYTPAVNLIYNNKESRFGGYPLQIWSDGVKTKLNNYNTVGKVSNITKDHETLLKYSAQSKTWGEKLDTIYSLKDVKILDTAEKQLSHQASFAGTENQFGEAVIFETSMGRFMLLKLITATLYEDGDVFEESKLFHESEFKGTEIQEFLKTRGGLCLLIPNK